MSFDELDKKIRDAADMHQPSYKEDAWANMEHLLDKHLPQKKSNYRRYFFWLIAFLVITSLMMILINRDTISSVSLTPNENMQDNEPVSINQPANIKDEKDNIDQKTSPLEFQPGSFADKKDIRTSLNKAYLNNHFTNKSSSLYPEQTYNASTLDLITGQENNLIQNLKGSFNIRLPLNQVSMLKNDFDQTSLFDHYNNNLNAPIPDPVPGLKNLASGKKSFFQKISFTASAGPSVSSVRNNNPGRITTLYGAGIKYALNNKWSLGSGFFINKKVYAAGKEDYRPPSSFWNYYTNLLGVDADCDVFEIPLTISYSIKKSGKHEWVASTGISNFIMKKETYNYSYKDNAGQIQSREWSIENNNMHHFSALTFSAGYKHHLNNRTSIMIEPNVKIPLKGVGYGKVKFYNAGTLITLQVSPFTKK